MRSPGSSADVDLVTELRCPPLHVLDELLFDRLVERRPLVRVEQLAPAHAGASCMVERAASRPASDVVGRRDRRAPEAVAETGESVLGAKEVAAVADLGVRLEGQAL